MARAPTSPSGFAGVVDPVVRSAVEALNARDRAGWFALFADGAPFSDDGIPRDLIKWCDEEFFGPWRAFIVAIDKVERGGLTFYARYHSDKWGDLQTAWKFKVEGGKVSRLDVGATSY